mmetsp:Transcript_32125/g.102357  ORF Transcript_32125/g.102357 Transcript_32125/m.102357 type:complete len:110 (-) Transcript_32125:328-657(-)
MPNSLFTRSVTRASKANDPHGRAPLLPTLAAVWGPMSPVRPARRLGKIPRRSRSDIHQSKLWKVKGLRAKKVEAGKLYYLVEWDSVGGQEWPTDWVSEEQIQRRRDHAG